MMDTREFDERNCVNSRVVCVAIEWRASTKKELVRELLDERGSIENIRRPLMPVGMEWPFWDYGRGTCAMDIFHPN